MQARIVKRQLQRMSIVPRVSLAPKKLTEVEGAVQFGWEVVYACVKASEHQRTTRLWAVIADPLRSDGIDLRTRETI